jgi:hypothetical protein
MIQRKGVLSFLIITFGITYLVEGTAIALGFRIETIPSVAWQFIVLAMMWVPSLATVLTCRLVTGESLRHTTGLRFGPWKYYLVAWLLVPLAFAIIYGLTWLFGLSQPDWQLTELFNLATSYGATMDTAPSPTLIIVGLSVGSVFAAVWFNSLVAFGEEWGWRGYLLPRLMPLGKWKAYTLMGIIWGLWHAPLIAVGFNYGSYNLLGIIFFCGVTFTLGIFINELSLKANSSILAAWIHGVFNSQGYGVWRQLFPVYNPLLGGLTGLVGIFVWLVIGLVTMKWLARQPETKSTLPAAG